MKREKMGYETTLLVGQQTNQTYYDTEKKELSKDYFWFQVYASIDLCKAGNYKDLEPEHKTPSYFYAPAGDGDDQIIEDRYGDKLISTPIEFLINRISEQAEKEEYRRFKWALGMLESMRDNSKEQLTVLIFGH